MKGTDVRTMAAALALFLGAFAFYARNAAPSVTAGDSGEFITAAATLSLPHSPSFPLYWLLGRCFIELVPIGSIPFRMNLFSAFTSAGAWAFLFLIARALGAALSAAALSSAVIGTTASFWANSLVTEVFSLNTFFACLLLWLVVKAVQDPGGPYDLLFAFALGLGVANHQILIVCGAVLAVAFALAGQSARLFRRIGFYAFCGIAGFSIYLTLPVRSAQSPPLNWGRPTTVERFYRTVTRKDYGSLKLTIGDAPERTVGNTVRHVTRFARQLDREVPAALIVLGFIGLALGWRKNRAFYGAALALFVLSGPFFAVLGNLPFIAQSDGVIGRFLILPTVTLTLGCVEIGKIRRVGPAILLAAVCFLFARNDAEASAHRSTTLILDYGRAMLRSLPPNAALYMDGGDDAFYSLAMLHEAQGERPDVDLHDRGGLIFHNPYGDDFRSLPRDQKEARRQDVERRVFLTQPLFYSTMNKQILQGVPLTQTGILYEARVSTPAARLSWPLMIVRSLYPPRPGDYRTRALACFFPYMRARDEFEANAPASALRWLNRALQMGFDVDWLKANAGADYEGVAYDDLIAGRLADAEMIYKARIAAEPGSSQAQLNLGVVYEREGRVADARAQYARAAQRFPTMADPVYNLSVLAWKEGDWASVVNYLEEVLRRRPDHAQARAYYEQAKRRLAGKPS